LSLISSAGAANAIRGWASTQFARSRSEIRKGRQYIAALERAFESGKFLAGARRADLLNYSPVNSPIFSSGCEVRLDCGGDTILESASNTLRLRVITREHCIAYLVHQNIDVLR
jgi:hypothetical protein